MITRSTARLKDRLRRHHIVGVPQVQSVDTSPTEREFAREWNLLEVALGYAPDLDFRLYQVGTDH